MLTRWTSLRRWPKGARHRGARIFTHTKVEADSSQDGDPCHRRAHRTRARFSAQVRGDLRRHVVPGSGGSSVGVNLPLHACEHYYVLFESVEGLNPELPVLRDYDACTYYKYDAGKLLVGAFEPSAKPWGMQGISEDFCFDEIAGDFDHFEPVLHDAMKRLPRAGERGYSEIFLRSRKFYPRCALPPRRGARAQKLLRGSRAQFDWLAVSGRRGEGDRGVDSRWAATHGSVGGGRAPQHALSGQPAVFAVAGE